MRECAIAADRQLSPRERDRETEGLFREAHSP